MNYSNQDSQMKELLEEKQYFNLPKTGDLIKGSVVALDKSEIHVDVGGIATGVVRGKERYDESDQYKNIKIGDIVEATVLELENEKGEMELSFQYAGKQKSWQNLADYIKSGEIIECQIIEANKGGLLVKAEGINGFLPVSQLSPEHYPRIPGGDKNRIFEILKSYIGKKFEVKVFDVNEAEEKLIVSEKSAWEETQKDVLNKYRIGMMVEGVVTAVTDFGIFVEFDDKLEGLIHISEIAWQRIENPNDFVKVGEKIKAEIIGVENSKIFLSMKKLEEDPWAGIEKKYTAGQKIKGKVSKINPFGLFVEIEKNIQGLAHISQMKNKTEINDIAKIGDELDFYVVSLDAKNHRLGLSLTPIKTEEEKTAEKTASAKATEKANKKKTDKEEVTKAKETVVETETASAKATAVKEEKEEKLKKEKTDEEEVTEAKE
jgi:small subunit ribosomal protein S1